MQRLGFTVYICSSKSASKQQRAVIGYKNLEYLPKEFRLKLGKKKVTEKTAYKKIFFVLKEYLSKDKYRVTAEEMSIELDIRIGIVKKVFMKLNREGLLSQAVHNDPRRNGDADWEADVYVIRKPLN